MTETTHPASKENKQDHAVEVRSQMTALKAAINSRPEAWFGGLPAFYEEVIRFIDHRTTELERVFEIAPVEGGSGE